MLEIVRMKIASTEVTQIRRRNDIEKSTCRTHRYFVDFACQIHVEILTSNWCHNFHVGSPYKINVISANFPRGISTSNRREINKDVSIGVLFFNKNKFYFFTYWKTAQKNENKKIKQFSRGLSGKILLEPCSKCQ